MSADPRRVASPSGTGGTRRKLSPTDEWARMLRLNERENVVSVVTLVLERRGLPADEIMAEVEAFFAKIEGAVDRG